MIGVDERSLALADEGQRAVLAYEETMLIRFVWQVLAGPNKRAFIEGV